MAEPSQQLLDKDDVRDPSELDEDELQSRLKGWYDIDLPHAQQWRDMFMRPGFDFYAGDQWADEAVKEMEAAKKPVVVFNRVGVIVDAVCGAEINNRQEVRYLPRTVGDTGVTDNYTAAGRYFRDQAHAEDEESDAFQDAVTAGMGWTETRLDFTLDPDGAYVQERCDPEEFVWDSASKKRNLGDAKRIFRARTMTLREAMDMFPDVDPTELDAPWARGEPSGSKIRKTRVTYQTSEGSTEVECPESVTIVHAQWVELEDVWRVKMGPQSLDMDKEKFDKAKDFLEARGVKATKAKRQVVKQAFIGTKILPVEGELVRKTLCGRFTWKCITGKRNKTLNQWYGLVKNMIDPQRWANKWMSQQLHILNTTGKGPIAEEGAVKDWDQFAEDWAKPDVPTMVTNGALQNGRIKERESITTGRDYIEASTMAIGAIRDVAGVNLEILGQADRDQPGVLEYQRSRQSMATLATLFANLRLYRVMQGELMLALINDYLADGRMIRIVGEEGDKFVPFMKQPGVTQYDVIVDDAPNAPNQKEITWDMIRNMPPQVQQGMTPEMWALSLEYSPAPASYVEKMKGLIQQAAQAAGQKPDPEMAKLEVEKAKAALNAELKRQQAALDAELERAKAEREAAMEGAQAQADMEVQRQKAQLEYEQKEREGQLKLSLLRAEHDMKMREHDATIAAREHEASMKAREHAQTLELKDRDHQAKAETESKSVNHAAALEKTISALAEVLGAETEIIRDPKTNRILGSRRKIGT